MILDVNKIDNIYIASESVDFRKGINGLSLIINSKLDLDPTSNSLFVFCNKFRSKIKIFYWDGSGWWLFFKQMERGRFKWPSDTRTSFTIDERQLNWLIQGLKTDRFIAEKTNGKSYTSW